jgi:peroxiredoxin Q/BCP
MAVVEVGHAAPEFSLTDEHGDRQALADYRGRHVVLYFYPRDDTSGCTKEACQFRDSMPQFQRLQVAVLGVSPDDEASHARFAEKHGLEFPLLADVPDEDGLPPTCVAYGVWQEKSMYGRTYMGVVRTTYLIDGGGRVVRRWDRVRVPGHVEQVLEAVSAAV